MVTTQRMHPMRFMKSSKVLFSIAIASACLAIYYLAAQAVELPGSSSLRDRWNSMTTRRGSPGHRSHRPRPNGPIDITVLGFLCLTTAWKANRLKHNKG